MKLMIASDLHGSSYWCTRMLEAYKKEQPDRLIFLGDILYHGPRNDLPKEYAPKEVIAQLSPLKEKILCVRGNCDFAALAPESDIFFAGGVKVFAAHGHRYGVKTSLDALLNSAHFAGAQLVLYGHTHIARIDYPAGMTVVNPGMCGAREPATFAIIDISPAGGIAARILPARQL